MAPSKVYYNIRASLGTKPIDPGSPREYNKSTSYLFVRRSVYVLKRDRCMGKIEKAKRYAEEKGRVTFSSFVVTFRGENDDHKVEYALPSDGNLTGAPAPSSQATPSFHALVVAMHGARSHPFCSHSMALQRMLEEMLSPVEVPQN